MKTTVEPQQQVQQQQQQQGRRIHSPLVRANVHLHNEHLQEKPVPCARKTPHEECCGYCDLYCKGKLTIRRFQEIEAWTKVVNNNMAALVPRPKAKTKRPKQPKIRYLKYQPPGTADEEEGFRWIRTSDKPENGSSTSQFTKDSSSTLLVANLPPDNASRLSSRSVHFDSVLDPTVASADSGHCSSQSSSNELLNVITIDDAMMQNCAKYLKSHSSSHPRKSATSFTSSMAQIPEDQLQERLDSIAKFQSSGNQLGYDSGGSISRAMNTITETRYVLNNTAHRGLFKDQQFGGGTHCSVMRKAESKKFLRLNDNLRRTIETDYVANSRLRQKVLQWGAAKDANEPNGHTSNGRRRPATAGHCKRPATGTGSRMALSARQRMDTADSSSKERLLEMIMQIDEDLE